MEIGKRPHTLYPVTLVVVGLDRIERKAILRRGIRTRAVPRAFDANSDALIFFFIKLQINSLNSHESFLYEKFKENRASKTTCLINLSRDWA